MSESEISKSKQKRMEIEKQRKEQKRKKVVSKTIAILIPSLIVIAIVVAVVMYNQSKLDYSRYLTDEGTIKGINIDDHVHVDYENITLSKADLLPSDQTVEDDILAELHNNSSLSDDPTLIVSDGDRVNVAYTEKIDGAVSAEVTAESGGQTMTIGYASVSQDFDLELLGHHVGDSFSTTINYSSDNADTSVAGQAVDYDITILGLYVDAEFNDEYVQFYHGDIASTAEEYRQYIIDSYYDSNLESALSASLSENAVVTKLPDNYMKNLTAIYHDQNLRQMEYYNAMYESYLGYTMYNNEYEMYGYSDQASFDAFLAEQVKSDTEYALEAQYIYEHAGLSNDPDTVRAYFTESGYDAETYNEYSEQYGTGYMAQSSLFRLVINYLKDHVTITD